MALQPTQEESSDKRSPDTSVGRFLLGELSGKNLGRWRGNERPATLVFLSVTPH
jgi:hypothetical protein